MKHSKVKAKEAIMLLAVCARERICAKYKGNEYTQRMRNVDRANSFLIKYIEKAETPSERREEIKGRA